MDKISTEGVYLVYNSWLIRNDKIKRTESGERNLNANIWNCILY